MFVFTVDQVDSRNSADNVRSTLADLGKAFRGHLLRTPHRTAGDEFQTAVEDPYIALDLCLWLTRGGGWNVGCGIGTVDRPLPTDIRAGSGGAFVAARRAVDAAKKSVNRCAVRVATDVDHGDDVGPLLDLLLLSRARRTVEGWEVYDLLRSGHLTQRAVAERLGITEQAVSARIRSAEIRAEDAARDPLARRFAAADAGVAG